MNHIKTVIFDMDGVLVNTEPLHFRLWKAMFEQHGGKLELSEFKNFMGGTVEYLFEYMKANYEIDCELDEAFRLAARKKKEEIVEAEGYPEIPGVLQMLQRLKDAGYDLVIASSSSVYQIEYAMKSIGAAEYFSSYNSAENVAHSKPAPDIYLDTVKRLGVQKNEVIVVEDSTNGTHSAFAAGLKCIGFYNPDSGNQDLSTTDVIISCMDELTPELIRSL